MLRSYIRNFDVRYLLINLITLGESFLKKKWVFLINIVTAIMLVGCAPSKEESDHKKNNSSEQDKNNGENIKLKVGSEEDDVKKDEKK